MQKCHLLNFASAGLSVAEARRAVSGCVVGGTEGLPS